MIFNYYQTYLSMIHTSVGSSLRKHFFLTKDDKTSRDILQGGNLSCAFYVSSVLNQFNLTPAIFANVLSLQKALLERGWTSLQQDTHPDDLPPWSIIIRDSQPGSSKQDLYNNTRNSHYHIGFYVWDSQAISNMSDAFVAEDQHAKTPQCHHYTYHDTRPIQAILTFRFTMSLTEHFEQQFPTILINAQLEIPFTGQTKLHLEASGIEWDNLNRALGTDKDLQHGRMCGPACIIMAYQYLSKKTDKTLLDTIPYRDKTHSNNLPYLSKNHDRYHDGLIAIAQDFGLKGHRGEIDPADIAQLKTLIGDCIDNQKVLILSVSPHFITTQRGGHLVVVAWYNRNGYKEELIINDPLDPKATEGYPGAPISIWLSSIVLCRSGKYIILTQE